MTGLARDPGFLSKGIEIEIWSLDLEAFGSFTAEVPPPLAIGTVRLAGSLSALRASFAGSGRA